MRRPSILRRSEPDWARLAGSGGATLATLTLLAAWAWVSGDARGATDETIDALTFSPAELVSLGDEDAAPGGVDTKLPRPTPEVAPSPEPDPAPANADEPEQDAPAAPPSLTDDQTLRTAVPEQPRPAPRAKPTAPKPTAADPRSLPPPPGANPATRGGKPTGDPTGFSDRVRDGDAWAADVLAALSKAPVGTFGGTLPSGTMRFKLTICPNGRIETIKRVAGGTIDRDGADRVRLAIEKVQLERPPPSVRDAMGGTCRALDYTFAWTATGVE